MKNILIIASTHLHLLDAIIIASSNKNNTYHLFFIDRPKQDDIYFNALLEWRDNPFSSQEIIYTNKSSLKTKIDSKIEAINSIMQNYSKIKPDSIIVGNDRKNETSAIINKIKNQTTIEYMDDGLHSYIQEKSSFLKYNFLDSILRSTLYKNKITIPRYIGASDYISKIYLYKPNLANETLNKKEMEQLDISILRQNSFKEYLGLIQNSLQVDINILFQETKHIIFLPHPKEMDETKINSIVKQIANNKNVMVKLHPRDKRTKEKLEQNNIKILDNIVIPEILFLLINDIKIYGFNTTVLLMAKWIRNDLDIHAIQFDSKPSSIEQLMHRNDINLININDIKL